MMTFEEKTTAFQLVLDLFIPYSTDIERFKETVLARIDAGTPLTDAQAARLLTREVAVIRKTMTEFAESVRISKTQLHEMLSQGRIAEAILFVRNWPDSMWRIYENVLDDFSSSNNPALISPHDVSRRAVAGIKKAFPISPTADDPLQGQDQIFIEQLRIHGNPWA